MGAGSVVQNGNGAADFFAVEVHLGPGRGDSLGGGAFAETTDGGDGFAHALFTALEDVAIFAGDGGEVDAFPGHSLGGPQGRGGGVANQRGELGGGLGGGGGREGQEDRKHGRDGDNRFGRNVHGGNPGFFNDSDRTLREREKRRQDNLRAKDGVKGGAGRVPGAGVEPAFPGGKGILSPSRLPFRHPGMNA